jgi:hypothetical protein
VGGVVVPFASGDCTAGSGCRILGESEKLNRLLQTFNLL